jgi:hypothetical protein
MLKNDWKCKGTKTDKTILEKTRMKRTLLTGFKHYYVVTVEKKLRYW